MNLETTLSIFAYGTSEGVEKEWDERGHGDLSHENLARGVSKDEAISATVPLSKLSLSKNSYEGALQDISRGRRSKTRGPISVFYDTDHKQFLVEDGVHRVVQAHQRGKDAVNAKVWSGYSDYIANVRPEDEADLGKLR